MTNIVAFPPVGVVGHLWTQSRPVQRSQSLFSGKRFVSAIEPARVMADVTFSALSRDRAGAGYHERLKRELDGGVHLIRMTSWPVNWHLDAQTMRRAVPFDAAYGGADLDAESGGVPLYLFSGSNAQGTPGTDALGPILTVTGLPPNIIAVRPGDLVRVYEPGDRVGEVAQARALARSGPGGAAVIRLDVALPAGTVSLGDSESRIFEAVSIPDVAQPIGKDWLFQWRLAEVFDDEIADPQELDPWQ